MDLGSVNVVGHRGIGNENENTVMNPDNNFPLFLCSHLVSPMCSSVCITVWLFRFIYIHPKLGSSCPILRFNAYGQINPSSCLLILSSLKTSLWKDSHLIVSIFSNHMQLGLVREWHKALRVGDSCQSWK